MGSVWEEMFYYRGNYSQIYNVQYVYVPGWNLELPVFSNNMVIALDLQGYLPENKAFFVQY